MNVKRAIAAGLVCGVCISLAACLPERPAPLSSAAPTSLVTSEPISESTPLPTTTPSLAPGAVLTRGPYLQLVTADTIAVVWETEEPSQGEVAYGETAEYGSGVADSALDSRHAVTLTGLQPYTAYHYRVESSGAPLSEDLTFRTAAGPDQTRFTFVVLGDTHSQEIHQALADRIVVLEPDFVLQVGDLMDLQSAIPPWEGFFKAGRELMAGAPLFPTVGNHDHDDPLYFDYFHLPGNERWYTFDYGNARFVCLQVDGIADYGPESEQYAWLGQTLAANTQPWLFVYFHIPPYTSSSDAREGDIRRTLTPLFERHGVDVVFNGHHHNYERNEVNGVTYVVSGGGGGTPSVREEQEPTQATFAIADHYVHLEIDGQHLEAMAISAEGKVLDTFVRGAE